MNDAELLDLKQVEEFVSASTAVNFRPANKVESYKWIARTLTGKAKHARQKLFQTIYEDI